MTVPPTLRPGSQLDHQEACKTFLEQTKLLITLASAFIFAPPAFMSMTKDALADKLSAQVTPLVFAEACFVVSVLLGYVTVGTIAGTQNDGTYDDFRTATRRFSLAQFGFYLLGIVSFIWIIAVAASRIAQPTPAGHP